MKPLLRKSLTVTAASIIAAVFFFTGLLIGGRAGYFLCFSSIISGYTAKSYEARYATEIYNDIHYGKDPRHTLGIHVPRKGNRPFPVLVFFHGGKWMSNSKDSFSFIAQPYLDHGVMFISAGYRLAPEHPYPASVLDCRKAVEWIYRNIREYGGDAKKIFVSGHSAGAHLCSLITASDEWIKKSGLPHNLIKGCIVVSGPTNLHLLQYREIRHFVTDNSLISEASPISHIRKGLPPFLVVYGTGDIMVPPRIPREFTAQLRKFNVPVNELSLALRTHSQTLDALGDPYEEVVPAILALINGDGITSQLSVKRALSEMLVSESVQKRDFFQRLIITVFTKAR